MATAAALRIQIEDALATRFPAALTPVARAIREVAATGVPAVDVLLEGGLPMGVISEVVGAESSGRTSLALSFVARRTAAGQLCAWVDADDSLDPESAAASGVRLRQLLWVRCCDGTSKVSANHLKSDERCSTRLDQALRVTDLLLQAGGFAAIVLDLGGMEPAQGMRTPLASWFRFRQAAERTLCCLVVLGRAAFAQSSAAVVVDCAAMRAQSQCGTVLTASSFEFSKRRQRYTPQMALQRKPPASLSAAQAAWSPQAAWAAEAAWSAERSA
jgi:hypothetical protein